MTAAPHYPLVDKVCRRCSESKSLDDFDQNLKCRDGKTSWCKGCRRSYQKSRRLRLREQPVAGHSTTRMLDMQTSSFLLAIRPDLVIRVTGLPADLRKTEAKRLERILMAHATEDARALLAKIDGQP